MKKLFSAVLAGLMLVGGAASVAAESTVYTAKDLAPVTYPGYQYYWNTACKNYNYYNLYYDWISDLDFKLDAVWNPYLGKFVDCSCSFCTGYNSGYYYVNGMWYPASNYVLPAASTTVTPSNKEYSKEDGATYYKSSIPKGAIKKNTVEVQTSEGYINIFDDGRVYVKNPYLVGSICQNITIPGKYYAYDKVDMSVFFQNNTYSMYLNTGDVQIMGTGYKMVSADSSIVKIVNGIEGQYLAAQGIGTTSVYLYTSGGVPFLRLKVTVTNKGIGVTNNMLDVIPGNWHLNSVGDSTTLTVKADQIYDADDINLSVVYGNGIIMDGKLVARGNGPIVVRAQHTDKNYIQGFAVIYVGQYVNALYDGYWSATANGICGNYWNPNLWNNSGYKVNGWVYVDGAYIPVISKVETIKPDGSKTTTTIYTDLYDLLNSCHGDVNTVYELLKIKYKNGKLDGTTSELYAAAMNEILEDIANEYYKQMH